MSEEREVDRGAEEALEYDALRNRSVLKAARFVRAAFLSACLFSVTASAFFGTDVFRLHCGQTGRWTRALWGYDAHQVLGTYQRVRHVQLPQPEGACGQEIERVPRRRRVAHGCHCAIRGRLQHTHPHE